MCIRDRLYKAMPELSDADEDSGVVDVRYGDRRYAVSTSSVTVGGRPHRIHYFFDETALKEKCDEYDLSRPSVLIITLDNFEELMENEKESDRIRTTAKIETIIDDFMRGTTGVLIRQRRDRFLAIMAVSYTHLDVYKRQGCRNHLGYVGGKGG